MKIINKKPKWFEFDKNSSVGKESPKDFIHVKFDNDGGVSELLIELSVQPKQKRA